MKNLYKIEDELYIVSDSEGVSENCWIITDGRLVQVSYLLSDEVAKGFKVIFTTNNLLINDGVQAINDEFLEWVVKNPNCEKVKVEQPFNPSSMVYGINTNPYKIIIPKEEYYTIKYYFFGSENSQDYDVLVDVNEFLYCVDVANVVVHPDFMGRGVFTNFMNRLLAETKYSVYVESILNDRVNRICLKLGFEKHGDDNMILKR